MELMCKRKRKAKARRSFVAEAGLADLRVLILQAAQNNRILEPVCFGPEER